MKSTEWKTDSILSNFILGIFFQVDISKNPIGDFFRHFISNIDLIHSTHRHKPSNTLPIPPISLVLLWQIAMSNQLGQIEIRHGLHMISPIIEIPNIQPETNNTIQYELIYPPTVEHRFTKILFLPIELKLFNRTNEQIQLQLQLIRYSFLFIKLRKFILCYF